MFLLTTWKWEVKRILPMQSYAFCIWQPTLIVISGSSFHNFPKASPLMVLQICWLKWQTPYLTVGLACILDPSQTIDLMAAVVFQSFSQAALPESVVCLWDIIKHQKSIHAELSTWLASNSCLTNCRLWKTGWKYIAIKAQKIMQIALYSSRKWGSVSHSSRTTDCLKLLTRSCYSWEFI